MLFSDDKIGAHGILVLGSLLYVMQQHFLMQCMLGLVHMGSL